MSWSSSGRCLQKYESTESLDSVGYLIPMIVFFSLYDDCTTLDDMKRKYVQQKIELFYDEKTLVRKTFDNLVRRVDFIEKDFADKSSWLVSNKSFDVVDQFEFSSNSETFLKPVFLADFSMNFTKCPVTVCLLIGPINKDDEKYQKIATFRQSDISEFTKEVSNIDGQEQKML